MAQATTDYKQFKLLENNRNTSETHIKKIMRSMQEFPDLFRDRPILINEKYEVIDGQHRLEAAKRLNHEVWYEVGKGLTAADAVTMNRNQKNWTNVDYAKVYALDGNKHYQKFLEMLEEYKLNPSVLQVFLQGSSRKGQTVDFREGKFEIQDEAEARKYIEWLIELADFNNRFRLNGVAEAALQIFKSDNYDHDRMVSKMQMWGDANFNAYGNAENIKRSMEDTYNFRQSEAGRVRLF